MNTLKFKLTRKSFSRCRFFFLHQKIDRGFTLVELLVTIIIISTLSAIALPSYLAQVAKARGSEARSNLGTINRAQQAYRFNNSVFAPDLNALSQEGMKISGTRYAYTIIGNTSTAITQADPNSNDLKVYAAGIVQGSDSSFAQVLCESEQSKGSASGSTATVAVNAGPPANANCSDGTRLQ